MGGRSVVLYASYWIDVCISNLCSRKIRYVSWMTKTRYASCLGTPKRRYKSTLPRKVSKLQYMWNRTANRHRWSGRVDQGERVRGLQGTRQNSSRNFGIRLAVLNLLRSAAAKDSLATVYQKHSSLRTRKWMYRGWRLTNARRLNIDVAIRKSGGDWYKP